MAQFLRVEGRRPGTARAMAAPWLHEDLGPAVRAAAELIEDGADSAQIVEQGRHWRLVAELTALACGAGA